MSGGGLNYIQDPGHRREAGRTDYTKHVAKKREMLYEIINYTAYFLYIPTYIYGELCAKVFCESLGIIHLHFLFTHPPCPSVSLTVTLPATAKSAHGNSLIHMN